MENKSDFESITKLSDDELLRRLSELLSQSRRVEAELVAHIGEVDARRLYAERASSSMFSYCQDVLNLSEHEAYLRITVARASRKHPVLLEMLADGRLHLSGIAKLVPVLTEANQEMLLSRAAYKSKRKIEELVAELSPKPDVPSSMRKRPERQKETQSHAKPEQQKVLGPDRGREKESRHGTGKALGYSSCLKVWANRSRESSIQSASAKRSDNVFLQALKRFLLRVNNDLSLLAHACTSFDALIGLHRRRIHCWML
jgi:hypothetical protein